jgi:hypothetical protein
MFKHNIALFIKEKKNITRLPLECVEIICFVLLLYTSITVQLARTS